MLRFWRSWKNSLEITMLRPCLLNSGSVGSSHATSLGISRSISRKNLDVASPRNHATACLLAPLTPRYLALRNREGWTMSHDRFEPKGEVLTNQQRAEQKLAVANCSVLADETPFSACSSNGGFWSGKVELLYLSMGID